VPASPQAQLDPGLPTSASAAHQGAASLADVDRRTDHRTTRRWLAVVLVGVGLVGALLGSRLQSDNDAAPAAVPVSPPPPTTDDWLTFPEGLTIDQMTERLSARRPDLDDAAFTAAIAAATPPSELERPASVTSMEGLLFPNTYRISGPGDEAELVRQMVGLTEQVAVDEEGLVDGARELGLTPYEVLIVASMIEEEARLDADRPKIARVIYNRLARDMRLQIDATLYYGHSPDTPFSELRELDSPYNSYEYEGLPPTPISNPGRASINAALNPADNPQVDDPICEGMASDDCVYLFYVIADDVGNHIFAATYEQHLENVEAARQAGLL
jgi:UPF0755 protein